LYTPDEAVPEKKTRTPTTITGSQQASEPNNARAKADVIRGTQISGEISSSNDADWYSFQATKGKNVSILITKPGKSADLLLRFYAPDMDEFLFYEDIGYEDTRHLVVLPIKRTGTHHIKVVAQTSGQLSKSGDKYTIRLSGQAPSLQTSPSTTTPTATSIQPTTQTTTINVKHVTTTSPTATNTETSTQTETSTSTDTTTTANTPIKEETTSMFGPGFTSIGAIVALLSAGLFAIRRR
jgi:PGF-CTERM protein